MKRRCGFLPEVQRGAPRTVWAAGGVGLTECPKSAITAESVGWLEAFFAWKVLGGGNWEDMWAKQCEAFLILETALRARDPAAERK